ncbi:ATPase, T2SS/T4P/T4SS family, partial [Hydrogenoanaerobacterium sp.]|uniref:ATPase, T2SS/T4P/T4SS family n=1 Tax=Hydrogenoanaerobacterium sp. TaxID=2953763 RepID=UPI00289EFE35
MSRHNLFFTPEQETGDFHSVLQQVQEYIAGQHSELLSDGNAAEAKANIKRYIAKFVQDSRVAVKDMTQQQLVDALYTEMAEYSFLTKYIFADGIEEIDINSWRDIEIQYAGGRCEKLREHFDSPEHCINVLRRMLHVSGTILDDQSPLVVGTLAENIRIAVMKSPIVDANIGAAASIRIVNPNNMEKEDFIDGGTATAEMLDFLSECIRYGISVCIAGATSSGKTTVAGWV